MSSPVPDTSSAPGPPTGREHPPPGSRPWAMATFVGALAAALSFAASWVPSLWTDESATISASGRTTAQLWAMLQKIDAVHGGYYLLVQGWTSMFGVSAVSLRLPSALAVGVAAAGVYLLGRRLVGSVAALWSAGLFAVLPRVTWMGIEARSWALTAAAAVWLTLLLVGLLETGTGRWKGRTRLAGWAGYGLLAAVAIALNVYLAFLLVAHGLTLLIRWGSTRPSSRWAWFAAATAGCILAGPVVLMASGQSGQLGGGRYSWFQLVRSVVVNQYALGETPSLNDAEGSSQGSTISQFVGDGGWWKVASLLLAAVLLFLCMTAVGSAVRARSGNRDLTRPTMGTSVRPGGLLVWVLPWIIVPTAILGIYSVYVEPLYNPRYLSFTTPAMALLAGAGLCALPGRWLRIAVAVAALAMMVPIYVSQRQVNAKSGADWRQVAAVVSDGARSGDGVYFAPRYPVQGTTYGQSTRGIAIAYPDDLRGLVDLTLSVPGPVDESLTGQSRRLEDSADALAAVDRVWEIRRNDDPAGTAMQDSATLVAAGFSPTWTWTGDLDTVTLYSR